MSSSDGNAQEPAEAAGLAGSVLNSDAAAVANDGARTHGRKRRLRNVAIIIAVVVALLAGTALAGVWYLAKNLEGNVSTLDGFVADAPVESYEPVNFLIMGSDNRSGGNSTDEQAQEITGERSDTTLLVHLNADRTDALVVSIPRDTKMELPECASESGQWRPVGKFNSAFTFGGPNCTVQTVEEMTGLSIQHAVVVDFNGFKTVVDALGGVDVCLTEAVYDPDSGLDLPAGVSTVTGDQALAFVRARKELGDGSDISRIQRQQQFLASAIRQATDRELLLKPVTMYRMLEGVTEALTVDSGLDEIGEMASMAQSLRNLRPEQISFVTMPFNYTPDGLDVVINESVANEIWAAIRNDEPWPKPAPADTTAGELTVAPGDIRVLVANGNGQDNAATVTGSDLRALGFLIAGLTTADATTYATSVVVFNPADTEAARTLQAAVPGSELRSDPNAPVGQLQLIVGANYTGTQLVDVARVPEGTIADPAPVTADQSICSQ